MTSQIKKPQINSRTFFFKFKNFFTHQYWQDRLVLNSLGISLLINLILWIFLILKIKPVSPLILNYNIYLATFSLGGYREVYLLPVIGLIFMAVNLFLSQQIYFKEKLAAYFLTGLLPLLQIFLFIAGICLFLINR